MKYAVGSLIQVRGREWVVLPDSTDELLLVKPMGGSDDEITGILTSLEEIKPASFSLPDPAQMGDFQSCRLLRDALRLSFRNSAGPFRSFGKLAVDPRPYQLVPLMMALRQETIRILISDDVGIGKTVEACLIARELLDRGEISSICVLCPPHLAEQWQEELRDKFNIDAEIISGSTVRSLERNCSINQSVFDVYSFTIVSIDYIKSDRHRDDFLRTASELVIVDEAHEASYDVLHNSSRHQRYQLVRELSLNQDRHLILVTATPHSGNEQAFRSLLCFLNQDIASFPEDLRGDANIKKRQIIADHFVQRRRADIKAYLEETVFPEQETKELSYKLSEPYRKLFNKALEYAHETVTDTEGGNRRQRVRWWSALTLLRSLASSPAAAASTMRNRSATLDAADVKEADEIGRRLLLDSDDTDMASANDLLPGSDINVDDENLISRRKLLEMAKLADALCGDQDNKMLGLLEPVKQLIKDGFSPIIFCRFIQTAEYLAEQLRQRLPKSIEIAAITGLLPPEEREIRVKALGEHSPRILVCTDCLSEGINLQEHFDAVIHYDLSWNPTRHEQREGRVDRFLQPHPVVRVITYYGIDNQIDGIVLNILLRKHKQIKTSLGISVTIPTDSNTLMEAIFEGLLLREQEEVNGQMMIAGLDDFIHEKKAALDVEWENAREKEKANQALFAQHSMAGRVSEVKNELDAVRKAIGSPQVTRDFFLNALTHPQYKATFNENKGSYRFDVGITPLMVKENCGFNKNFKARFDLPVQDDEVYLSRTHPYVEGLADLVLNTALDNDNKYAIASRCGVIKTNSVRQKTVLLLLRYRFHLVQTISNKTTRKLVEDSQMVAYTGDHTNPLWLPEEEIQALLQARSVGNVLPQLALAQLEMITANPQPLISHLDKLAQTKNETLIEAHTRVRKALNPKKSPRLNIQPELPPDVLGIYVYLPEGGNNA